MTAEVDRNCPDAVRDLTVPTAPGAGDVDPVVEDRARSASSTTLKNGASSTTSPNASHGPPDREMRSERVTLRSTIHFCSVFRSRNRWTLPSSVLSVHSGTLGPTGSVIPAGGVIPPTGKGTDAGRVTMNVCPHVVH